MIWHVCQLYLFKLGKSFHKPFPEILIATQRYEIEPFDVHLQNKPRLSNKKNFDRFTHPTLSSCSDTLNCMITAFRE